MNYLTSFSHLSPSLWTRSFALLFFFFIFGFYKFFFLLLFILLFFIYLFRKTAHTSSELVEETTLLAPMSGVVQSISRVQEHNVFGKDLQMIVIRTKILDEYTLYLPIKSEVLKVEIDEKRNKEEIMYFFKTNNQVTYGISFGQNIFGFPPHIPLLMGDRGVQKAMLGYYAFGGETVVYLNKNNRVLVREGERVLAGQSLLADTMELRNESK